MGKVGSSATMSLDGYIAFDDNTVGALFDWYEAGDVEVRTTRSDLTFHVTPQSAEFWRTSIAGSGALVVGRTLFDFTDGWGGRHPIDLPVVVVTHSVPTDWVAAHPDAPFTFVTEGGVAAGIAAALGLLDHIEVDIAPVVMGRGKPYFGDLGVDPVLLDDPTTVIQGNRVLHLVYPVRR
jgi:dihydrofolate reductase